ncbi:MAG: uroporphyrinogen-III synthase [Puniceicoccales bacterium]|jgi:uroporphyrinogen-III synthase|nr:uroporphyrinogen-III synthase [Puniceicoccales bacterium]
MSTARPNTPLAGKRVVITRPQGEASSMLCETLRANGAEVLEIPLLDIEFTADNTSLDDVWASMGSFDWMLFTSANGVRGFFERFFESFNDIRGIGLSRIACVGKATTEAVRALHLNVDFQPKESTAEALAHELMQNEDLSHLNILLVIGTKNSDTLAKLLEKKAHAIVKTLAVYATTENDVEKLDAAALFRQKGADAILFASPSAVDSFVAQAKALSLSKAARQPRAIAIGPTTSDTLREYGIPIAAQAPTPTVEGCIQAILQATQELAK